MGWASGMRAGTDMARGWIDTYQQSKQQREYDRITGEKPEEISNAYTTQDAEQLRALANAKDAQGNPYYNLEAGPDGSYGLKTNFAYQGQDGQLVQPGGVATSFAPRETAVDFMGTRYAQSDLTDSRIEGLRARALAGAVSRTDPVRGIGLMQQIKSGERDDTRFGWEEQQQPLKQRAAELGVQGLERTERQGVRSDDMQAIEDEVAKMPLEAVQQYAAQLNTNTSNYPMLYAGADKNGYKFLTIDPKTGVPTGKAFEFNEAQLRQLAAAGIANMKGYGAEALQRLASVNKEMADYVTRHNQTAATIVTSENDALSKGRGDEFKQQGLKLQERELGVKSSYYNRAGQNLQKFQNEKGEVVMVDVAGLPRAKDGTIAIPQGLKPINARPEFSFADVTTRAKALVESGAMDPDNPKVPLSLNKAIQIVQQEASTGQPYMSAADRIAAALAAQENGGPAPATDPTPTTPQRGLLTDRQGNTQLLEPFSRLGDWRRNMVNEANQNMEASGIGPYLSR
jgi:hypothetical protein